MTDFSAPLCPECGAPVLYDLTCHTYPGRSGGFVACMPCDSAVDYFCSREECGWDYVHGLNPKNPRSAANEARRPPWITGGVADNELRMARAVPGVQPAWE